MQERAGLGSQQLLAPQPAVRGADAGGSSPSAERIQRHTLEKAEMQVTRNVFESAKDCSDVLVN